jgi:hypothetical protein
MAYQRLLDKTREPTADEMLEAMGPRAGLWRALQTYLDEHYAITPETVYGGARYGWTVRYRKGGRTLCSLFPETDAFTALVVLGAREAEKALAVLDGFSPAVRTLLGDTEQLHDGRWLWLRVLTPEENEDVMTLLRIKRRPIRR